ncbi:carbohydrate porin [Paraliomyxa miuraensis]|uniref:carbohydrate porin n=1 Tax=Paraliomyxa miuraensis TaxID=376150 RepID=UPI00224D3034|nr:carbohydrate porin [Paraliomyxa miuraensis]
MIPLLAAAGSLAVPSLVHAMAPGPAADSEPADEPVPEPEPEPEPPPPSGPSVEEVQALQRRIDTLERQVEVLRQSQAEVAEELGKPPPVIVQPSDEPATAPSAPADLPYNRAPDYADGFHFGSYGRVVIGGDHRGRAFRNGDIVAYGSRLDESTYAELELRREDYWEATDSFTRIVATMAVAAPLFHQTGSFDTTLGMRNLYIEESGLGLKKLRLWAGSRMYRGDDIYLLNFWPLDNLNTMGGGAIYGFTDHTELRLHAGANQPRSPLFYQQAARPLPYAQPGAAQVPVLDRQKVVSSARFSHIFWLGDSGAGIKPVVYGETHYANEGQREVEPRRFETLPRESGWVVGTQLGMFTGKRSTHLNLVFRAAGGLAAYGEFNAPHQLAPDNSSRGAREYLLAAGGNYEVGPFGLLLGSYWRSFRNASPSLDFWDLNEGALILRPTVWLGEIAGISVEGSYQAQRRGVLVDDGSGGTKPLFAQVGRVGIIPFVTPGGRGNFTRPHITFTYLLTMRDAAARSLYPEHDVFGLRKVDHFIALGAEWWFGSTSYFRD